MKEKIATSQDFGTENGQSHIQPPDVYKGKEKYIFVSYSHKDYKEVWSIISQLNSDGYRVWYDDGIVPGIEWDEDIADHIKKSFLFIAMMSENYLQSSNCKDELKFANDLKRNRLIIYLTDVELPAAIQMRAGRIQAIYKSKYPNGFFEKLYQTPVISECRGEKPENDKGLSVFPETRNNSEKLTPMLSISSDGREATVLCGDAKVTISERHGSIRQEHVDECLEYIKLEDYYNKQMEPGHLFKVRWMFYDNIDPCNAVGVEYLYDQGQEPKYSKDDVRAMFHDEWEFQSGVFWNVQVTITKVDMKSDYFFEND
ncbi:MAG: toll/interleukin-1 receptor domain-containing protein [bacterium]|nr:toll/interleukin-1 receptor domain-containing protein [bacterium]MDY4099985.1 toll/interleukin-1 receptor domain-containing protein [Lachnospiraceae bacterium]